MEINMISYLCIYSSEFVTCSLARTSLGTRGSASNVECQVMCSGVRFRDAEKQRRSSVQLLFAISQLFDTFLRVHRTYLVLVSSEWYSVLVLI
jgi:hypothetical protein